MEYLVYQEKTAYKKAVAVPKDRMPVVRTDSDVNECTSYIYLSHGYNLHVFIISLQFLVILIMHT